LGQALEFAGGWAVHGCANDLFGDDHLLFLGGAAVGHEFAVRFVVSALGCCAVAFKEGERVAAVLGHGSDDFCVGVVGGGGVFTQQDEIVGNGFDHWPFRDLGFSSDKYGKPAGLDHLAGEERFVFTFGVEFGFEGPFERVEFRLTFVDEDPECGRQPRAGVFLKPGLLTG